MTELDDSQERAEGEIQRRDTEQRSAEDIRLVMSTEQGRRVIWSLLEQGRVFATTFTADPYVSAFNEGQRNLALALFQRVMQHCPQQYLAMADEASKQE